MKLRESVWGTLSVMVSNNSWEVAMTWSVYTWRLNTRMRHHHHHHSLYSQLPRTHREVLNQLTTQSAVSSITHSFFATETNQLQSTIRPLLRRLLGRLGSKWCWACITNQKDAVEKFLTTILLDKNVVEDRSAIRIKFFRYISRRVV